MPVYWVTFGPFYRSSVLVPLKCLLNEGGDIEGTLSEFPRWIKQEGLWRISLLFGPRGVGETVSGFVAD